MPSSKIIELEQTLQTYSVEDKQWLLQKLIQQLGLKENSPVNYKQQAKEIIAETISEVIALSDECEKEIWQKYDLAKAKISQQLKESDLL
jgi:predicted P-loop ATPase/GTPase